MKQVNIKSDRSEKVFYNKADYPAYIKKGVLSAFPDYTAESHWHDDVEFIYIISGHMFYNINGKIIKINKGEGVFVNARQLHFGYSENKSECIFICVLLHPMLLCFSKTAERDYINPIIFNEYVPFYHLKGINEWEKNILNNIKQIYNVQNCNLSELKIQKAFLDIWINLSENIITIQQKENFKNYRLSVLKNMISYININYKEKLTLKSIANSGSVGKTACCCIFKKYINKTPIEYLTEFRLRKGVELLCRTDMTVLEICYSVGFSGASYFSEIFKKYYKCTPTEYRKIYTL